MKAKLPIKRERNGAPVNGASQIVRFDYVNPQAKSVFVAGTFNDWHPAVTEMLNVGDGRWLKQLSLPPGKYEYRLVVNGVWMIDPGGTELVPNPFGEQNSVLNVPPLGSG